jgi:hypothetical protein
MAMGIGVMRIAIYIMYVNIQYFGPSNNVHVGKLRKVG